MTNPSNSRRKFLTIGLPAVVLVVVIFLLGRFLVKSNTAALSTEQVYVQKSAPAGVVNVVLECEEPTTIENKMQDGAVEVLRVRALAEGDIVKFLEVMHGAVDYSSYRPTEPSEPLHLLGRASYDFNISKTDTYYIYLRAKWVGYEYYDAVCVRIDNGKWYRLEDTLGKVSQRNFKWVWHPLQVNDTPKGFDLAVGRHTLWFNAQADGEKLDQWLISTDSKVPINSGPVKK